MSDLKQAWEYSFIHSSATGRGDEEVGPCLTYDKKQAFGVGCIKQREVFISTQPEATAPTVCRNPLNPEFDLSWNKIGKVEVMQDLSAAMTAKQCLELETIGAEWMSESGREVLADWIEKQTASSANALSAGDRVDAERYRWYRSCGAERDQLAILDARGNIIPEELDAEIDARLAAILQSQKAK